MLSAMILGASVLAYGSWADAHATFLRVPVPPVETPDAGGSTDPDNFKAPAPTPRPTPAPTPPKRPADCVTKAPASEAEAKGGSWWLDGFWRRRDATGEVWKHADRAVLDRWVEARDAEGRR